jgi:glucose/mannose-6-phosphate isomerase
MISYEENLEGFGDQLSFRGLGGFRLEKLRGKRPDGIVVCGMGGSGIPGLILEKLAGEIGLPVPVATVSDDRLPRLYFKRPLFIIVSFSGETAETIACLKEAMKFRGRAGIAAVTTGGKLKATAEMNGLPLVAFPSRGLTPRESSGTMFHGIVKVLEAVFPLKVSPLRRFKPVRSKGLGEQLARKAKDRNILIYTDHSFAHLGYIWKTNLNETAKIPAFTNIYTELNHNEIAGFEKAKGAWMIFWLKGKSSAAVNEKIKIISKIIGSGVKSIEVPLEGRNMQEKTWNGVVLSHWVSLYLAKLNKVDPRKTNIIDRLKKQAK